MTTLQPTPTEALTFAVDPVRLAPGLWCPRAQKLLGEGDIAASYSADCIGMGQPVRRAFEWQGALWVCVSMWHRGGVQTANAYRLVHPQQFNGQPSTYAEKTRDSDAARADPNGFHHGIAVKHAGQKLVLSGPPVTFVQGQTQQLNLFDAE